MVLLMDVLALGSFIFLELLQLHHFSCKSWLICKMASLGSFTFYHFLIFFRNSRAIIYLIGPDADGAFCLGSWHWLWAGGISYFHVSSPPEPCLSGGSWSHRHNRAVCTPNYLQGRWQRPGNEQRDNKFPSKGSSTPALQAAPSRALKGDGFSRETWKKAGIKMLFDSIAIGALLQEPRCVTQEVSLSQRGHLETNSRFVISGSGQSLSPPGWSAQRAPECSGSHTRSDLLNAKGGEM